jgi:hypothetical protein
MNKTTERMRTRMARRESEVNKATENEKVEKVEKEQ